MGIFSVSAVRVGVRGRHLIFTVNLIVFSLLYRASLGSSMVTMVVFSLLYKRLHVALLSVSILGELK